MKIKIEYVLNLNEKEIDLSVSEISKIIEEDIKEEWEKALESIEIEIL